MILNSETFNKVVALFPKMPYTGACYCGAWTADTVDFQVGVFDEHRSIVAGVHVRITQEFKLVSVKRIFSTWGRYSGKKPLITEKLPIHPAGQLASYRNRKLIACMGDMRHYEFADTNS